MLALIQGPHCIADFRLPHDDPPTSHRATELVVELARVLGMKRRDDPRIVSAPDGRLSIYQIVATSHIICTLEEKEPT